MQLITEKISRKELKTMADNMFGELVKAVVDIEQKIMVVDAELHADEEFFLLERGSKQEHLWGINLFPDKQEPEEFVVFDSMINLRPIWGNKSRGVDDPEIQEKIRTIVHSLVVA